MVLASGIGIGIAWMMHDIPGVLSVAPALLRADWWWMEKGDDIS
jgi:hypothetical protein